MKRKIEIDDVLDECVQEAKDAIKLELFEYLNSVNPDEAPDLSEMDDSGTIHEIIDGAVPIYNGQIDAIFFLHGDRVEGAFEDAGIGSKEDKGWPMGWKAAAIYCYIEQEVNAWYRNKSADLFEEWAKANEAKPKE